jgi:hypothetical protein
MKLFTHVAQEIAAQDASRRCLQCGGSMAGKSKNAKYCRVKCKDRYNNLRNPRGKFAHLKNSETRPDDWRNVDEGPDEWGGDR